MLMYLLLLDSIFHDPETHILFASFKYVGYNWAGDSKEPFSEMLVCRLPQRALLFAPLSLKQQDYLKPPQVWLE